MNNWRKSKLATIVVSNQCNIYHCEIETNEARTYFGPFQSRYSSVNGFTSIESEKNFIAFNSDGWDLEKLTSKRLLTRSWFSKLEMSHIKHKDCWSRENRIVLDTHGTYINPFLASALQQILIHWAYINEVIGYCLWKYEVRMSRWLQKACIHSHF
jgi:hypothetical protein